MDPKITVTDYMSALGENKLMGLKCHSCGFVTAHLASPAANARDRIPK